MKTRIFTSFLMFVALTLVFSSCASKEEAEKASKEFYNALKAKDYDKVMGMIHPDMIENEGKEKVESFIMQKEKLGELKSYTQESDHKWMEKNGRSMVRLLFTVEYEAMTLYEYIVFSKTDDGYLVVNYAYHDTEEKRKEYIEANE